MTAVFPLPGSSCKTHWSRSNRKANDQTNQGESRDPEASHLRERKFPIIQSIVGPKKLHEEPDKGVAEQHHNCDVTVAMRTFPSPPEKDGEDERQEGLVKLDRVDRKGASFFARN